MFYRAFGSQPKCRTYWRPYKIFKFVSESVFLSLAKVHRYGYSFSNVVAVKTRTNDGDDLLRCILK